MELLLGNKNPRGCQAPYSVFQVSKNQIECLVVLIRLRGKQWVCFGRHYGAEGWQKGNPFGKWTRKAFCSTARTSLRHNTSLHFLYGSLFYIEIDEVKRADFIHLVLLTRQRYKYRRQVSQAPLLYPWLYVWRQSKAINSICWFDRNSGLLYICQLWSFCASDKTPKTGLSGAINIIIIYQVTVRDFVWVRMGKGLHSGNA